MGILDLFRRKGEQLSETEVALASGVTHAETGRQTSELEQQKLLAENGLLINDPQLQSLLLGMGKGSWTDADGILGVKNQVHEWTIPKYIVLSILGSPLIRTSYLDPAEAEILTIEARCILRRVKMKMSDEDFEKGGALIVDAAQQIIRANIQSAMNGRMAKLVKVTARSMEVSVQGAKAAPKPGVMSS